MVLFRTLPKKNYWRYRRCIITYNEILGVTDSTERNDARTVNHCNILERYENKNALALPDDFERITNNYGLTNRQQYFFYEVTKGVGF